MRIRSLFMMVAVMVMISGCGGGMNSSNSDAPKAVQAHEATWVTYHRDSLFNFNTTKQIPSIDANGFAVYSSGQAMVNENVIQCRVCHGPNLAGPRENFKGYACLSCHVLDPVIYPVRCYSCHGAPPVVPIQEWMSTAGRKDNSDLLAFIARVQEAEKKGTPIHLKHDALPKDIRDSEQDCRKCHGDEGSGSTVDVHHAPDILNQHSCFYCHSFGIIIGPGGVPVFDFTPNRNCTTCHADLS